MRIIRQLAELELPPHPRIVAIGNFDGVHLGHRRIIEATVREARATGLVSTVLTFDPHPVRILRPDLPHAMLTTFEDKAELFAEFGADETVCLTFDRHFATQDPDTFVRTVLAGRLGVRSVFVGANYKFGHHQKGNVDTLAELGQALGFTVHPQSFVSLDGERISSSRIRTALLAGDVATAAALLGRRYRLKGQVVTGHARGREMGHPTANLAVSEELMPADGVYAAQVFLLADDPVSQPGEGPFDAVAYIGTRPTFGASGRVLEAHLLDVSRELHGRRIAVEFAGRVRGEMTFENRAALAAQIRADVLKARRMLSR